MIPALVFMLLAQAPPPAGRLVENVACPTDPSQTYTLYLPSAYTTGRRWPVLFVFDPRGRGTLAATLFKDAAERFGWIVASSNNTRSDTTWEPNRRALAAMVPAVLGAYAADEQRIYAAGFSGGAGISLALSRSAGGLAGIIAAGSPEQEAITASPLVGAWFASSGRLDFNYLPSRVTDDRLARARVPHRLEHFEGAHEWMPRELAALAVGWLEALAMKTGRRPRDAALAAALAAEETAYAGALEVGGHLMEARRALASIVDTYGELTDISAAAARARTLDADDRYTRARRDDDGMVARERAVLAQAVAGLQQLYRDEPPMAAAIAREMNVPSLRDRAGRQDRPDALSARRVLEQLFVQTGFYIWRDAAAQKNHARAALSLEVATLIFPDRIRPWIDLAAMRAAINRKGAAIEALERAVQLGLKDAAALTSDERLAPLRDMPAFQKVIASIGSR